MRRDGFTLMELMVAMACAGIITLVALGVWKNLHGDYVLLQRNYQASSKQLLQDLGQTKNRIVDNPDPNTIQSRF